MTMAAIKFNKGSEEWLMFMDYWNLCQRNWKVEQNGEYWQKLIVDCDNFLAKYKGNKFASRLIMALQDTLEERG